LNRVSRASTKKPLRRCVLTGPFLLGFPATVTSGTIDTKKNCPSTGQVLPILSFTPVDHHQNRKPGNGKQKEWHIILVLTCPDCSIQHQSDPDQNHYADEQSIF
jgi:hypothetical protein